MSGLVGYASSEDEEPEADAGHESEAQKSNIALTAEGNVERQLPLHTTTGINETPSRTISDHQEHGPAPTVARPPATIDPSLSPRSAQRALIQSLTMPRFPNFDIPPSPSPPAADSEEADDLRARTKKFDRFLELKKQGIHFNTRLAESTASRNPAMTQRLLDFAGLRAEEQYGNTLGENFGVPTTWPDEFLEELMRENEKRIKKAKETRTKLDFVPARNA